MKKMNVVMLSALMLVSALSVMMYAVPAEAEQMITEKVLTYEGTMSGPFIENKGQWHDSILFGARAEFGAFALTETGLRYDIYSNVEDIVRDEIIELNFKDGNPEEVTGIDEGTGVYNFIIGNDPEGWVSGARSFDRIYLENVWDGIDIEYYQYDGNLKYDIVLEPYSDPTDMIFEVNGYSDMVIRSDSMSLRTDSGVEVTDGGLNTFYDDGDRQSVESRFVEASPGEFSFEILGRDVRRPVRIDPIVFSTFIGGFETERSRGLAMDDDCNIYISGETISPNFPVTQGSYQTTLSGNYDALFMKMDETGNNMLSSTFFGGTEVERVHGIDIAENGDIVAVGSTTSDDLPVTPNAFNMTRNGSEMDIFVLRMDPSLSSLSYSTYFGGTDGEYFLGNRHIEVDSNEHVVITGSTRSSDFPITDDAYDGELGMMTFSKAFVSILSTKNSNLKYSTYLGGSWGADPVSIHVNDENEIYISGTTNSGDHPTTPGAYQESSPGRRGGSFISKLDPSQTEQLVYSTYFSGPNGAYVSSMDVDDEGCVYITGRTLDDNLPVTEGAFQDQKMGNYDCFLTKMNPQGTDLVYSTYFGGMDREFSYGIRATEDGGSCIVGFTISTDLPSMMNYTDEEAQCTWSDGFVLQVDSEGKEAKYISVFGGDDDDVAYEIILCNNGDAIICGETYSSTFPMSENAFSSGNAGDRDMFLMRLNMTLPPAPIRGFEISQGDATMDLSWDEPAHDGGLPVDHYNIYRGDFPSIIGYYNSTEELSFIDSDVTVGQKYFYMVSAVNGAGGSPLSPVLSADVVGRPGAPINVRLDPGDGMVSMRWNRPYVDGDLEIDSYKIYRSLTSEEGELIAEVSPFSTDYIDESVTNGLDYEYWLTTTNDVGESDPTDRFQALPAGLPTDPMNLTIEVIEGKLLLQWDPPEDDGGIGIEGYHVHKMLSGNASSLIDVGNVLQYIDEDVNIGSEYSYYIVSLNSLGESEGSRPISSVVTTIPGAPTGISLTADDSVCILNWEEPENTGGTHLTGYRLLRGESGNEMEEIATIPAGQPFYMDRDVENGVEYEYLVISENDIGLSAPSQNISGIPAGAPLPPETVTITQRERELVIEWNSPSDDGGSEIKSYRITRRAPGEETIFLVDGEQDHFNDTNADPVTIYEYTVQAVNKKGASEMVEKVIGSILIEPSRPADIDAIFKNGKVFLTWSEPETNGGSEITSYGVMRSTDNGSTWDPVAVLDEDARIFVDEDIYSGSDYSYYVEAVNSRGVSDWSDIISITPTDVPGIPTIIGVIHEKGIEITWRRSEDGGSPIIYYIIERSLNDGPFEEIARVLGDEVNYIDFNIDDGISYSYRITAVNSNGNSDVSGSSMISIPEPDEVGAFDRISSSIYLTTIIIMVIIILSMALVISFGRRKKEIPIPSPAEDTRDLENNGYSEIQTYMDQYQYPDEGIFQGNLE